MNNQFSFCSQDVRIKPTSCFSSTFCFVQTASCPTMLFFYSVCCSIAALSSSFCFLCAFLLPSSFQLVLLLLASQFLLFSNSSTYIKFQHKPTSQSHIVIINVLQLHCQSIHVLKQTEISMCHISATGCKDMTCLLYTSRCV